VPIVHIHKRGADRFWGRHQWLAEHLGVEIISRNRGGAYAEGGRRGAPHALQVADRFHVNKNLRETVDRFLVRNHRALREPEAPMADHPANVVETADVVASYLSEMDLHQTFL
jgi:transposase